MMHGSLPHCRSSNSGNHIYNPFRRRSEEFQSEEPEGTKISRFVDAIAVGSAAFRVIWELNRQTCPCIDRRRALQWRVGPSWHEVSERIPPPQVLTSYALAHRGMICAWEPIY
jgi:hypothetical protein